MNHKFKAGIGIVFNVTNIDRTEKFYNEVLGIHLERQEGGDHGDWLMGRIGTGIELMFFQGAQEIGRSPIVVFELEEGGIETAVEKLAKAGVEIVTPVSEAPGGWSADFIDPDGHPLSFYQSGELPVK